MNYGAEFLFVPSLSAAEKIAKYKLPAAEIFLGRVEEVEAAFAVLSIPFLPILLVLVGSSIILISLTGVQVFSNCIDGQRPQVVL